MVKKSGIGESDKMDATDARTDSVFARLRNTVRADFERGSFDDILNIPHEYKIGSTTFFGKRDDPDWSIDHFDPALLRKIDRAVTKAHSILGQLVPLRVQISDATREVTLSEVEAAGARSLYAEIMGTDRQEVPEVRRDNWGDLGISQDYLAMDVKTYEKFCGEQGLIYVLGHEATHKKFRDGAALRAFKFVGDRYADMDELVDLYHEGIEQCAGLILSQFGTVERFEREAIAVTQPMTRLMNLYKMIELSKDTLPAKLAAQLIDNPSTQKSIDEIYQLKTGRFIGKFFEKFHGKSIAVSRSTGDEPVDYKTLLPSDDNSREIILTGVRDVYKRILFPSYESYLAQEQRLSTLSKAFEHRADASIGIIFGAKAAHFIVSRLREEVPIDCEAYDEGTHPTPLERIGFIEERFPLAQSRRPAGVRAPLSTRPRKHTPS